MRPCIRWLPAVATIFGLTSASALASDQVHDEIQIYNADIAEVGQWTYQQHLNYAAIGQTVPEFPGGFTSNHSLQGTPEFAYGITNWWEGGFYLPFAVTGTGEFLSDGAKIRSLFVIPDAAKRSFFYGVNFELGYELPPFALSQSPLALEIRPIIGVRNKEWEFIVNPIVDVSFGPGGEADFAPAVRLARDLGEDSLHRPRILRLLRQDGRFFAAAAAISRLVRGHRFQGERGRRRTRRRLSASPPDRTISSSRRSSATTFPFPARARTSAMKKIALALALTALRPNALLPIKPFPEVRVSRMDRFL